MTRISFVINSFLGSALIIGLLFADYIRKYNTDRTQRAVFLKLLIYIFISLICDMLYYLCRGIPGRGVYYFLYSINTVYYLAQVFAYYAIFIFVDYSAFKDPQRTQKIRLMVLFINLAHLLLLLANWRAPFYFYIDPENYFFHGKGYGIRLILSYLPVLLILCDMGASPKLFKSSHISLAGIFAILTGLGSTVDILAKTSVLLWPCITAALLYGYFFIIRTDSRIDALTGIGNRFAFNELIAKLSRQKTRESYAIIMIDMDHFKQINDTLGHLEGDRALKDMAAVITGSIRSSDFAARYGGDEFVLLIKVDHHPVEPVIARITQAVVELNEKRIRPYQLQMSYGYDIYTTSEGRPIQEFLKHIDCLMYKHKKKRRRRTDTHKEPQ